MWYECIKSPIWGLLQLMQAFMSFIERWNAKVNSWNGLFVLLTNYNKLLYWELLIKNILLSEWGGVRLYSCLKPLETQSLYVRGGFRFFMFSSGHHKVFSRYSGFYSQSKKHAEVDWSCQLSIGVNIPYSRRRIAPTLGGVLFHYLGGQVQQLNMQTLQMFLFLCKILQQSTAALEVKRKKESGAILSDVFTKMNTWHSGRGH